jgi:single-strand DNA-binding protein
MSTPAITIIGNLTADPELRWTPSGVAVCDFTVASTNRVRNKQTDEWEDGDTVFIRCAVWEQYAENVAETLRKGQRVIVTGRLKVRQYETREGGKGTSVECTVDEVGPSLKNASAKITRNPRPGDQPPKTTQRVVPEQRPAKDPWETDEPVPF